MDSMPFRASPVAAGYEIGDEDRIVTEDENWILLGSVSDENLGIIKDQKFGLPERDAINLIDTGIARLAQLPKRPPTYLPSVVKDLVTKIEFLGPAITDQSILTRINEEVFPRGIRQALVDGQALHWKRGKVGLRELVGTRLSQSRNQNLDIFFLFRFVAFECIDRWIHDRSGLKKQVYGQEYASERPDAPDDFSIELHAQKYSSEWHAFAAEALHLQADFEALILQGLTEGRILVGPDTDVTSVQIRVAPGLRTRKHSFSTDGLSGRFMPT